jgi:spore coat polysaccharide biosynthesis protein SpsF
MLTILQARMSSTRLPGKVLMPLAGAPMLTRQIERVRRATKAGRLVVATSSDRSDDPIEALCRDLAIPWFRGSLEDVLGRYRVAARAFGPSDHIVRLTGDCPLTDWRVIDAVIEHHLAEGADYTSNTGKLTFPKGLDVEVFRGKLLEVAAREATDPFEREHVTAFFYRRPERFKIANLECDPPMGELRWTVDTSEDYSFVQGVYEALYAANPAFTSEDVANLTGHDRPGGRDG